MGERAMLMKDRLERPKNGFTNATISRRPDACEKMTTCNLRGIAWTGWSQRGEPRSPELTLRLLL